MQFSTPTNAPSTTPVRKNYRPSPARRLWEQLCALGRICAKPLMLSLLPFFYSLVTWLGVPSPCAAAFLVAADIRGVEVLYPILGLAASLVLRLSWGAALDIWQYAGCLIVLIFSRVRRPKTPIGIAALAGIAMMPRALEATFAGHSLNILLSCAAVPLCMALALGLRRGLRILAHHQPMLSFQDRVCALLPIMMALSGLCYLRFFQINLGQMAATLCTLAAAFSLGAMPGATGGLLCGLMLALCGFDARIMLPFALGGLFSGLLFLRRRRWLCALLMLFGHLLATYLMPLQSPVLSHVAVSIGCLLFLFTSEKLIEWVKTLSLSAAPASRSMEGQFVQQRLQRWESAMRSMAAALPSVATTDVALPQGRDLGGVLCADCSQRELCWGRDRYRTERVFAELLSTMQSQPQQLAEQLPILKECGCIRLQEVTTAAKRVQRDHQTRLSSRAKARFEREMTMTHLDAMASTISEIRSLTGGETLSDLQAAFQISKTLRDLHFPAELCYARRVDGHLQAAIELDPLIPSGRQPDRLLRCLASEGLCLNVIRTVKNRIELEEQPLYSVELGVASICAGQSAAWQDEPVSGDAVLARQLDGGRYVLLFSDGMGHGPNAHQESNKTLELLQLCIDAGYSRRQSITAVNGMMLSSTDEERFATVDLFDISLWTGEVQSEKLGACPSWVVRGNYIKQVDGSSLPLGILEEVQPTSQSFRMHSGDILIAVSDGVADTLNMPGQMEQAILDSVYIQPQRMADALLRNALLAGGGTPRDDMTVIVLLLMDRQLSAASDDA